MGGVALVSTESLREYLLSYLYGSQAESVGAEINTLLARHSQPGGEYPGWSQRDAWLITYADQFQAPGATPLQTLHRFLTEHLASWLNGVHILPFYPWSSDDGFSVIDYLAVDPTHGTWKDIERLGADYRLGVDAVFNHMSAQSEWFRGFLEGDSQFQGFFRTRRPGGDYTKVVRPRTSPLFTTYPGADGPVDVWTTFSADQVDLDFANPRVFLRTLDVLLEYCKRGASFVRLDAIGLLWKEEGTPCMHMPQTHAVIQLWRACLDRTYPDVILLTETNVPHAENVSYFGDGSIREAQMVYQFPLAPLVLHAYRTGDATALREWAAGLGRPRPGTTFFNFLASHDGVGVRPLEGLVASGSVEGLAALTERAGGRVSSRTGPDGSAVPYELNSTWFDLLAAGYAEEAAIARHLGSHAIQLALQGIPGIYVHSLFGSPNDQRGYAKTGRARSLNRQKFADIAGLEASLKVGRSARVFDGMRSMLSRRSADPAFHPDSEQEVIDLPSGLFGVRRMSEGSVTTVIVNLGDRDQKVPGSTESIAPFGVHWSSGIPT